MTGDLVKYDVKYPMLVHGGHRPLKPLKTPEIPLESIRPLKMSLKLPEMKKHP